MLASGSEIAEEQEATYERQHGKTHHSGATEAPPMPALDCPLAESLRTSDI